MTLSLRKSTTALGDCYEAAGRYIMDNGLLGPKKDLILVHGEVEQQGHPFLRYGHAWVEDGDTVIDVSNGRDIQMPKVIYYTLGRVYPDKPPFEPNIHTYTVKEFQRMVNEHKHWGPWDLETSSGY